MAELPEEIPGLVDHFVTLFEPRDQNRFSAEALAVLYGVQGRGTGLQTRTKVLNNEL